MKENRNKHKNVRKMNKTKQLPVRKGKIYSKKIIHMEITSIIANWKKNTIIIII